MPLLAALIILCTCCRKGGINDELDGQWRIISIQTLPDGTITEPQDRFICLYLHTVNLTTGPVKATGNMTYSGDKLTFEFPYEKGNPLSLSEWGIYDWTTTFTVEHLSSSNLILRSDSAIITLKKF